MPTTAKTRLAVLETKHKYESRINTMRSNAHETALKLAAIETERRLLALNGEAARLSNILAQSMPRELAEQRLTQLTQSVNEVRLALTQGGANLSGRREGFAPTSELLKGGILLALGAGLTWLLKG